MNFMGSLDGEAEIDVAVYAYDALGRRIWKYDPTAAAPDVYYYHNDQWQILAEYTGDTTWRQWFAYGNYIDEVLSSSTQPVLMVALRYYAHDHLYSPAALTNASGTTVWERYEYDAYGKVTVWDAAYTSSSNTPQYNPYTFTGRRLDTLDDGNLELMYYRNRYYSPEMGRFMTQDLLGVYSDVVTRVFFPNLQYTDGISLFEYVQSNPMKNLDYLGLACGPGNGLGDILVPDNPWPLGGADFGEACGQHDDCYGGNYGCENSWPAIDRESCDMAFKRMMKSACAQKYGDPPPGPLEAIGLALCNWLADTYYSAVDTFGKGSYEKARQGPPCNQCP